MITDRELIRAFVAARRRGYTEAAREAERAARHRFIDDPLTTNAYQAIVDIQAAVPAGNPQTEGDPMSAQSEPVRRFADAWKRGDDDEINTITGEILNGGNDADIVAMSRVMANTAHGGK
ncbi:hypothetical protein ACFU5D_16710 [Streptomyces anthocyanicus]|uniref:hypothetical protein n=1 Tax=Streptomyces anthocyanicus TaxID=68174 RepID=UPI0036AAD258